MSSVSPFHYSYYADPKPAQKQPRPQAPLTNIVTRYYYDPQSKIYYSRQEKVDLPFKDDVKIAVRKAKTSFNQHIVTWSIAGVAASIIAVAIPLFFFFKGGKRGNLAGATKEANNFFEAVNKGVDLTKKHISPDQYKEMLTHGREMIADGHKLMHELQSGMIPRLERRMDRLVRRADDTLDHVTQVTKPVPETLGAVTDLAKNLNETTEELKNGPLRFFRKKSKKPSNSTQANTSDASSANATASPTSSTVPNVPLISKWRRWLFRRNSA